MRIPTPLLKMMVAVNVTFLLLLGFSYPYVEPGTPSYVAAVLTLGAVCVMLTLVSILIFIKWRRETL
ncbi:hypothetical protein [Saliphagus infecundisoli]|uniref:Uncharacterized protein n=1 Tax=Saliphagus infecundisoli TaxID=1849069 RepID=A0ABD5QI47_9EURY|nr:hypothetical protein [Saliphagus infecundisoli]